MTKQSEQGRRGGEEDRGSLIITDTFYVIFINLFFNFYVWLDRINIVILSFGLKGFPRVCCQMHPKIKTRAKLILMWVCPILDRSDLTEDSCVGNIYHAEIGHLRTRSCSYIMSVQSCQLSTYRAAGLLYIKIFHPHNEYID